MSVADPSFDPGRVEIRLGTYGIAPATSLRDNSLLPRVQDYRRQSGTRMYPLDRRDILRKLPSATYHVSRKVDGEFTVLVYRQGEVFTINPGGTIRVGLPFLIEAAERLKKAGKKEILVAGELYAVHEDGRRTRVHDATSLARHPKTKDDLRRLRFAAFDIVQPPGGSEPPEYTTTWDQLEKWFGDGELIHPVPTTTVRSAEDVERLFRKWVEEEGEEGLVVRSDSAGLYKIKPRHSLDVVIVGFTEATEDRRGMLHDLLVAVVRADGGFHLLCRVGGGFSDELRKSLLSDLRDEIAESEYAEVNSDHVAYQMVRPTRVIEISCLDLVSQTTRGGPVNRMVLHWNDKEDRYEVIRRLPLCSVISPQFMRMRDDKSPDAFGARIQQVADRVEVPMVDRDARQMRLPQSALLNREAYTKVLRGGTMVRKFLMWRTNKSEESDEHPEFVIHFTDFSPNRKNPLIRDIRVSNSCEQIEELWKELKESQLKQGWVRWWEPDADGDEAKPAGSEGTKSEPKKPASKKKAAKKKASADKPSQPVKKAKKAATKKKTAKKKTTKKKTAAKKAASEKPSAKKTKKTVKKKAGKKKA